MCGICGSFSSNGAWSAAYMQVEARTMLDAMRHRGPDGEAVVQCAVGAMGANRLAIRSLGDDQPPLLQGDAGVVIACNAEIDNHVELRQQLQAAGHVIDRATDIAVVLPLYLEKGMDFVQHLRGVFAIAIWDPRQGKLILVRDRSGERHLYYSVTPDVVRFSSEFASLQTVASGPAAFDRQALAAYVGSGFCPSGASPMRSIRKVRPGEMVVIDARSVREHRYWTMPAHRPVRHRDPVHAFDGLFREAVHKQAEADVDYGVLLSGGVDSSLIAAVARQVRPSRRMLSYGIRFGEDSFNESDLAARTADAFGYDFMPVTVAAEELPATLKDLIRTTGELLADPAWIPLAVLARRASRDVRMVLSGEGADELFGGYPTYLGVQVSRWYQRFPLPVRGVLRAFVRRLPASDRKVTVSFLLKRFVEGQNLGGLHRHRLWTSHVPPETVRDLGLGVPMVGMSDGSERLLDQVQRYDFEHPLAEALLAKADRAGMRHGLEVRAPFLDQAVIDFACTLPARARVRRLTTKHFLKQYAALYLPASTIHRRKRGLSVPLASWLRGPLSSWARSRLSSEALAAVGVDTSVALGLLAEHDRRMADHSRALWTLIVMSEWANWMLEETQQAQSETAALAHRRVPLSRFPEDVAAASTMPPVSLSS